ncbi:MAG: hypothetical protein EPO08_11630 [Rhodospirillaceae bacterium]|nr:MAG: hypothetical protein EPO08_11630 [Rhodospirillaceae bacterium]
MKGFVNRPPERFSPGKGVLRNDHFQMAYVTSDIARACAIFTDRYGLREYQRMEGEMPGGGYIRIALAWAGGTMFELIQAEGAAAAFYTDRLPPAGFAIRHHHLGYFIRNEPEWEALGKEIETGGWKVVFNSNMEGFMRACYIEAPELGHYLEYILPEPAGIDFFNSVPIS